MFTCISKLVTRSFYYTRKTTGRQYGQWYLALNKIPLKENLGYILQQLILTTFPNTNLLPTLNTLEICK